jgi:hypothetical protein
LLAGLNVGAEPVFTSQKGRDRGVRLRDLDKDGRDELLVSNDTLNAVFSWADEDNSWKKASFAFPAETSLVDAAGRDNGLRFVDLNSDGFDDLVFSKAEAWSVHLFISVANRSWVGIWLGFKVSGEAG